MGGKGFIGVRKRWIKRQEKTIQSTWRPFCKKTTMFGLHLWEVEERRGQKGKNSARHKFRTVMAVALVAVLMLAVKTKETSKTKYTTTTTRTSMARIVKNFGHSLPHTKSTAPQICQIQELPEEEYIPSPHTHTYKVPLTLYNTRTLKVNLHILYNNTTFDTML